MSGGGGAGEGEGGAAVVGGVKCKKRRGRAPEGKEGGGKGKGGLTERLMAELAEAREEVSSTLQSLIQKPEVPR